MMVVNTIKRSFFIRAARHDVWNALVDPKILAAWGAGPARMSARTGAKFSLWGGDIFGKNVEVVKEKKLVQEWSAKAWEKPSKVTIVLKLEKLGTKIELTQTGVPKQEYASYRDGWQDSYFAPLKSYLEERGGDHGFEHHQGG